MQHIYLVKGSDDPNTYLVNDTADPLQRSLTCLELTDVLMGAPPPGASTTWPPPTGPLVNRDVLLAKIATATGNLHEQVVHVPFMVLMHVYVVEKYRHVCTAVLQAQLQGPQNECTGLPRL